MTAPVFVDTNVIVYRYDRGVSEILCLGRLGRVCSIRWDSWHCSSLGRTAPNSPTGIRPKKVTV